LQAENGLGLEVQRDAVLEYAGNHGIELIDVVQEAASGGVREGELFSWEHRPTLLWLIERAEAGDYDVLLVARFDRLARDNATVVILERLLERHNVRVVSATEENGDGPVAAYLRGNLALIAELERGLIRQRLDFGRSKARSLGNHAVGRIPYGYRPADKACPASCASSASTMSAPRWSGGSSGSPKKGTVRRESRDC
jgi:site-specific DNA recombinase